MQNEMQDSDAVLCARYRCTAETMTARRLLNSGVESYLAGDYDGAERDFRMAQKLATACNVTRNTARIYRAVVMFSQHWPGKMRIPDEAAANDKLLVTACELYQQVLADSPNEDQKIAAEQGLRTLR